MTLEHVLVQVQRAVHRMGGSQVSPQAQVGPQSKNPSTILLKVYKDEAGLGPVFFFIIVFDTWIGEDHIQTNFVIFSYS